MEEKNRSMTDEALSQQLRRHKSGKLAGRLLSLVGVAVAVAGMVLGGNIVPVILGGVILALGQTIQRKTREQAGQQAFRAIAPDVVSAVFENVQIDPAAHLLNAEDTNIPLPGHSYCSGSGYIRGTYQGLTTELCTVKLTEVDAFQREESGQWEKNEHEVYTGQWLLCELEREIPTWLTIWPRAGLDRLLSVKTVRTGNEDFDRRFCVSCGDEAAALRILMPDRAARILTLADSDFGKFAVNLNRDGRLYLAVHSGRGFFDVGKGNEDPAQLRRRFAGELSWFAGMIDVFRDV